jgi:hypothetical protein
MTKNNPFETSNPFDEKHDSVEEKSALNTNWKNTSNNPFGIEPNNERETLKEKYERLKDRNTNFIFFFGKPASGKSHVMASLIYYMKTSEYGDLITLESNTRESHLLVDEMFNAVQMGTTLNATPSQIGGLEPPTEIDFVFRPKNKSQPEMRFTFLEMSGENLEVVQIKKNKEHTGQLPETIDIFLRCPDIKLFFFLLTSHDEAFNDANLLNRFLDYVFNKNNNFDNARYLLAITKWDTYRGKFKKSVEDFASNTLPQVYQRLIKEKTINAITNYSLGIFEKDKAADGSPIDVMVKTDTTKAELVTEWLYKEITGRSLVPEPSLWQKTLQSLGINL